MTTSNPETDEKVQTEQDHDLEHAMKNLRKPRQVAPVSKPAAKKARPQTKKTKAKKPKTQSIEQVKPTGPDDIDGVLSEKFDLKGELTIMELRFIELYLMGGLTIENAMKTAGYINYHPKYRYTAARKIIEKYESNIADHRKIMRAMGYGETKIIQLLIDSAENAKSETVKLNARIALAKALGLQKEIVEGPQGVRIIINAANGESLKVGVCIPPNPDQPLPQTVAITK
jgi:hypothetical protein